MHFEFEDKAMLPSERLEVIDYVCRNSHSALISRQGIFFFIFVAFILHLPYQLGFEKTGILLPSVWSVYVMVLVYKMVTSRNRIKNPEDRSNAYSVIVTENNLLLNLENEKREYNWDSFISYKILKNVIILFWSKQSYVSIPIRILNELKCYDEFRELVTNKINKEDLRHFS